MGLLGRITRLHVLAAGCVAFIAVGVVCAVLVFRPRLDTLRDTRMQVNTQMAKAQELPKVLTNLAEAHAALLVTKGKFDVILAKQPKLTVNDANQAAFDLWREYGPLGTGTILTRWFLSHGYVARGIAIPAPPLPPVQIPPLISLPMSGFGLTARDFSTAMRFLKGTADIPRLFLITNMNVSASSGRGGGLDVPMSSTVFIITQNAIPATPTAVAAAR